MGKFAGSTAVNGYNPDRLFDVLIANFHVRNDKALARMLDVSPPMISKIRHRKNPLGAPLLIRIHEVCGLEIRDLQCLMGDRREKFRVGDFHGRIRKEATLVHARQFAGLLAAR